LILILSYYDPYCPILTQCFLEPLATPKQRKCAGHASDAAAVAAVRVADEAEGNSSEDPEVAAIQVAARVLMEVASTQDPATRPSAQRIHEVPCHPARAPDHHAAFFLFIHSACIHCVSVLTHLSTISSCTLELRVLSVDFKAGEK
jgi:hypothetical protein